MKTIQNKVRWFTSLLCCLGFALHAQEAGKDQDKAAQKALSASTDLTWEANNKLRANDFINAEATYRKAISKSADNAAAPFNLGNAYYDRQSYGEAFGRYKQATEATEAKNQKHKAFHNIGNVFMQDKAYPKAVEAYKEALRNNPDDDETRYNLALAKKKAEQQQNQQKKDDKKGDEDQNKDQNNKKDDAKPDEKQQNEDKNDKDDSQDKPQEEGNTPKKQNPKPGETNPNNAQQQQPRPDQLSKQQIENLLEAMENEERKVQEKMNAKKIQGKKIRNEKDW